MPKVISVELREQSSTFFEVKVWLKYEDGTILNVTEGRFESIEAARREAADHISSNIIDGIEEITFYHSKP